MDNRKIIEEKGAITVVVCAVCLLIIVVVIFLNIGIQNKKASSDKEIQKITNEYNQEESQIESTYQNVEQKENK